MTERDFLSLKREMWNIISKEGLIVTNQNLDWILERTYKSVTITQAEKILSDLLKEINSEIYDTNAITAIKQEVRR